MEQIINHALDGLLNFYLFGIPVFPVALAGLIFFGVGSAIIWARK